MQRCSFQMAPASLLPSPLFFSFLSSLLVPVTDVDPECRTNSHKIGVLLGIQNSVSLGSGWGSTFLAQRFESGGQERHKCHLEGRQIHTVKGKAVPLQVWGGPEGSRKLRFPDFMTTAQEVVSLTHRPPLPPGNTPGTHFCWRLSRPQGHSATGEIISLKNSNDIMGNRTRNLPVCSVVP
jgi:hypothetical protein